MFAHASMNRVFRIVWNASLGVWQAVGEIGKRAGKGTSDQRKKRHASALAGAVFLLSPHAYSASLPSDGVVTSGSGAISQQGNTLNIIQNSNKMAIDWQSFSVGKDNTVNFIQPSASSVALNRVVGNDVSNIQGAINANGQVFLINPNGVLFSTTAQVNVGGLVASTRNISNEHFNAHDFKFEGSNSNAIINQGNIKTADGGYVVMISAKIENTGTINAHAGTVALASGNLVTVDMGGAVKIKVEQGTLNALIDNGGAIQADGGYILLTAKSAGDLVASAVNNTGLIEATSLNTKGGKIVLLGDDITNSGRLSTDGKTGGGEVLVGGDWQGSNADQFPHAVKVTLTETSSISANAAQQGDGGKIVAWSDIHHDKSVTKVAGKLSATSKGTNAKGGKIETSGKVLVVSDQAQVNTNGGEWLLDPVNITVGAVGSSTDITHPNITNTFLNTQLANNNITLTATNNININEPVSWSQNTLTLSATNSININTIMTITGAGSLTMTASTAYDKGVLMALDANKTSGTYGQFLGRIDVSGTGVVTINNNVYTRVDDATALQNMSSNLSGNYYLGADITSGLGSWTSINSFAGALEGFGHTLTNLTSTSKGMFGDTTATTRLTNFGLAGGSITAASGTGSFGALASQNLGIIANVYSTASVTGVGSASYVGGLVAINRPTGRIINSYASGNVIGSSGVGGLSGYNDQNAIIKYSYATGNVSYNNTGDGLYFGGLVGDNNEDIAYCYATGTVIAKGVSGGLLGQSYNSATVSKSYATGDVKAGSTAGLSTSLGFQLGGLIGFNGQGGTVTDSYATGNIVGYNSNLGGLIGNNRANLTRVYATGNVTTNNPSSSGFGGLVGGSSNDFTITDSYATGNVVGKNSTGGLIGSVYDAITVTKSYYTGTVTSDTSDASAGVLFGLIYTGKTLIASNVFWNSNNTHTVTDNTRAYGLLQGTYTPTNVVAKTTAELQDIATFTAVSGWSIGGSATGVYPTLTFGNSTNTWSMGAVDTPLAYTLSTLALASTVYDGNAKPVNTEYGGAGAVFGYQYKNWVAGTDYKFVYATADTTDFTNAGTYSPISVVVLKSGYATASSGNTTGSLTIAQRTISVTPDTLSKGLGASDPTLTYQITTGSLVGSDTLSGALSRTAGETANTYPISLGTLANSNYSITLVPTNFTINSTTPIYLRLIAGSSIYGDTPTFTYGLYDASSAGNTISDATPTGTIIWTGAPTTTSNVGTYSMTYSSGITLGNSAYTLSAGGAENWTITARPITITADAKSKAEGAADPALTYQVTTGNLVNSDTLAGALSRTAGETAASYPIALGSVANSNYAITFVANNLTITPTQAPSTPKPTPAPTLDDYNGFTGLSSSYVESLLNTATTTMISNLTATEASQIVQNISDFNKLPYASLAIIIQKLPSETFITLGSNKVANMINALPDLALKTLPLTVKNNLLFSLSEQDFSTVTLPNLYTNEERLINMANMPLNNINAQSQGLLMNALSALSGAEISTLGATKIAELINKINLDFTLVPDSKVLDIIKNIPAETFSQLDSSKVASIINTLPDADLKALPLTVKNSLIFSLSVPDFLSVSLPNLYTNEERLVNMANMPLDNINAQSQVLLMSALEALSGAEIATLGATKVAELINKINLDFTTVPEAKVLDIVAHLPSDTFNHIEQDKLISIANRLTAQNVQTLAFTTQRTIRSLIDPEGLEAEIKTTSIAIASTVQSSHQSANSVTPKNVAVDQPKIDSIITKIPTTGMVSANHVAGIGGYSGGLAFVETVPELIPTNDTKNTVTRSTITNTDRSGIDPSGFMKVFVVNGGINLPIQINPTTDAIINNN